MMFDPYSQQQQLLQQIGLEAMGWQQPRPVPGAFAAPLSGAGLLPGFALGAGRLPQQPPPQQPPRARPRASTVDSESEVDKKPRRGSKCSEDPRDQQTHTPMKQAQRSTLRLNKQKHKHTITMHCRTTESSAEHIAWLEVRARRACQWPRGEGLWREWRRGGISSGSCGAAKGRST